MEDPAMEFARPLLLATLMAAFASPATAESDGAALFEAQCGRCHMPDEIPGWAATQPDEDERLEGFLKRHHAREAEAREAIIAYIEAVIVEESSTDAAAE
jgi:mono/diheme cytochrome c family protein